VPVVVLPEEMVRLRPTPARRHGQEHLNATMAGTRSGSWAEDGRTAQPSALGKQLGLFCVALALWIAPGLLMMRSDSGSDRAGPRHQPTAACANHHNSARLCACLHRCYWIVDCRHCFTSDEGAPPLCQDLLLADGCACDSALAGFYTDVVTRFLPQPSDLVVPSALLKQSAFCPRQYQQTERH
jgi:hypothetical protein